MAREVQRMSKNFIHKVNDKMARANSADPDQTVPEGGVCHSTFKVL